MGGRCGVIDTSQTLIVAPFAGRDRQFQLRLGEISELERSQGAGIGEITERVLNGRFYARDVWETLRLGLEGGGMPEHEATALMGRYHTQPIVPYVSLASRILAACLAGTPPPETPAEPGKPPADGG